MEVSTTVSTLEEGRVDEGTVVDQILTTTPLKGETMLLLTVKVEGKLRNDRNVTDGVEPVTPAEREVALLLPEGNDEGLRITVEHLERLGFSDNDVRKLHPDHPEFVSLIDRKVHVAMKSVNGSEYWNLRWPRGKAAPAALKDLDTSAESLKSKIDSVKRTKGVSKKSTKPGRADNNQVPY